MKGHRLVVVPFCVALATDTEMATSVLVTAEGGVVRRPCAQQRDHVPSLDAPAASGSLPGPVRGDCCRMLMPFAGPSVPFTVPRLYGLGDQG